MLFTTYSLHANYIVYGRQLIHSCLSLGGFNPSKLYEHQLLFLYEEPLAEMLQAGILAVSQLHTPP